MSETAMRVSIVLPVYNGEARVRQAIASCLQQTYEEIELVVVDDCSTDRTPEVVKSFNDPRIVYIRNRRNAGLPRALNIGFASASGDYLTWTSDDNEYAPTAIAEMLRALQESPQADFVYADYTAQFESTGETELRKLPDEPALDRANTIGACFLYTRRVYQAVGDFDPRMPLVEDYDYWIRVSKRFRMKHLAKDLYLYRYHAKSLTSTKLHQARVLNGVLMFKHGFISSTALNESFYSSVSSALSESGNKGAFSVLVGMLTRVRAVSNALAVRFALVVPALWFLRKVRKLGRVAA
jgi:glycosyltransferase involved in cell wall biosynthesis